MGTSYTIGELAKAAGVPVSTLRYYERAELLVPCQRSAGNYRMYDGDHLGRLRFIKAAQATGFTLDDVRVMLGLADGTTALCEEVQTLIGHRLDEVAARLKDLRHVQKVLRTSLDLCRSGDDARRCQVLECLAEGRRAGG